MSYEIDQDGDRYSAFRDLKSPQDEVNQRRSKALHLSNSRRVIADDGAVDDVELARREYARADGWVVKNPGKEIITEDAVQGAALQGNLEMLAEAKTEIDTYGPNPGLIGTEVDPSSGRAIQLAAGGRHRRDGIVHGHVPALEAARLPQDVVRRAEVLAGPALDPGHRRPSWSSSSR